jgi:dethiobiotin synthetase
MTGLFVTGTDTGVGKTFVTAALLTELRRRGLKAAAFKPIACGEGGREDARIYGRIMNDEVSLDVINPVYLRHPLAPSVAARLERRAIDLAKVFAKYKLLAGRYSPVLVEGAGGFLVPIRRGYFVADLARDLKLPLLIVARAGLGTINHTLLTVRQARAMGLAIAGIVLNNPSGSRGLAEKTNAQEIPRLTGVPVLGGGARGICRKLFGDARVFQ